MAVQESGSASGHRHGGPEQTPRLRLKRKAASTGYVDGAWWPHTADLPTELPDLIAVLSVRLGAVQRVSYNLAEWAAAPRKLPIDGHVVRMDGYHRQPPNTIGVSDGRGNDMILLVVPAETDPDRAHAIVMAAAATGDASSVDSLLTTTA